MSSLFPPQFQIISDLHLETPLLSPSYTTFSLPILTHTLFLLGDIGLAKDPLLFDFLEKLLKNNPTLKIFYIMGNHEYYQLSHPYALQIMQDFENRIARDYLGRFILLHRRRYDLNPSITILGCTLWSQIPSAQESKVENILTDFHPSNGIRNWSPSQHNTKHTTDLIWLNDQVSQISTEEPNRQIIILTHHSPTVDPRANDPKHLGSTVQSGFVTNLSKEKCWISPSVKMWAFGHTHFNCQFHDELGKLVVANQKGYTQLGSSTKKAKTLVVEAGKWEEVKLGRRVTIDEVPKVDAGRGPKQPSTPKKKGNWIAKVLGLGAEK